MGQIHFKGKNQLTDTNKNKEEGTTLKKKKIDICDKK
jgi:hypothetical protein